MLRIIFFPNVEVETKKLTKFATGFEEGVERLVSSGRFFKLSNTKFGMIF